MAYEEPVASLLTLGQPADGGWRHYPEEFGLTIMHLPALRKLMLDQDLLQRDPDADATFWGPIHAMRAGAQLGEVDALLHVAQGRLNPDAMWSDFPVACALVGPRVLPGLQDVFKREASHLYTGSAILSALERIAADHPDTKSTYLDGITQQLEHAKDNDPTVNGMIVTALRRHDVRDALPVIERAYQTGNVDKFEAGDWEAVQVAFGLKEPEEDSGKNSLELFRELGDELKQTAKTGDNKKKKRKKKGRKRK